MPDHPMARPAEDYDDDLLLREADEAARGGVMLSVEDLVVTFGNTARGRQLRKQAGGGRSVLAVNGVSFTVSNGEFFTLLGPSGCGKTTTLRAIAGLEHPKAGTIEVAGRTFFDGAKGINVAMNDRHLGMLFQSYAIWPHMTVYKNVSFPLEVQPFRTRLRGEELRRKVEAVLSAVQLSEYAQRPATKLSGGQQQRLALARALVAEPPLLLLDEPLSNLDAKLRDSMRFELKRLQRDLGVTAIYVTHDQSEALALSTRIAVMNAGKIVQIGKPREIYERPASKFVADFIGLSNILTGVVASVRDGACMVRVQSLDVAVDCQQLPRVGDEVSLLIRPECVQLRPSDDADTQPNVWPASIVNRIFLGDSVDHMVDVAGLGLRNRSNPGQSVRPGSEISVHVDPSKITIVNADS